MQASFGLTQAKSLKDQLASKLRVPPRPAVLALLALLSLVNGVSAARAQADVASFEPNNVSRASGNQFRDNRSNEALISHSRGGYRRDGGTGAKHHDPHYRHRHRHGYPWGWGLGVASSWNSYYGWGWHVRPYQGGYLGGYLGDNPSYVTHGWDYRHSPYSSIGLAIPRAGEDEVNTFSAPVRVTTGMQYSPDARRMVSTPVSQVANMAGAGVTGEGREAAQPALQPRAGASLSSLPSNARVVQRDGRTLYEWQGTLYAFDWNSQTYQAQGLK